MRVPLARSDDLVVEELGDELLVYDLRADHVHSLSSVAARVWRTCDGRTSAATVATELGLGGHEVDRALDELRSCELLAPGAGDGLSRRELTVRVGKGAMAAAVAPLIVSITAPTPAAALTLPPGCEGIGTCSGSCGQSGEGCKAETVGCVCCQYPGLNCRQDGQIRASNLKFCSGGTQADCPPDTGSPRPCATLCTAAEIARSPNSAQSEGTSGSPGQSPGNGQPPNSPNVETPPSTVPETPTTPTPGNLPPVIDPPAGP